MAEASSLRLSVSALRDYRKCPRYYAFKRIDKIPEIMTHHAAAGNLVHASFYMAYGYPVVDHNLQTDRTKLRWEVSGDFSPKNAIAMLEALWWREPVRDHNDEEEIERAEAKEEEILEKLPEHLHQSYLLLADDNPEVTNFVPGMKKALKGNSQKSLREGWFGHFKEMLVSAVQQPLPYPVKEIEREVRGTIGGINMLAYLDLVLDGALRFGPDSEIGIDLKSGYNKPSTDELFMDDQIQTYRKLTGVDDFWLFHMRSGEMFSVDYNEKLVESLEVMAEEDALAIEMGYFPKRYDKQTCNRCAFRKHCHGV